MFARVADLIADWLTQRSAGQIVLIMGLSSAILMGAAFFLGERAAYSGMGVDPSHYRSLKDEALKLRQQVAGLESELGVQRARAAVDTSALEMVRKDLAAQREEIVSLEEGLRFYRSLMTPGEIAQGLSLRPLELVSVDGERQFAFRIVAQQEARKHALLNGRLKVEVVGTEAGLEVSYPLSALSPDFEGESIDLRFRYFQSIEGELTLPLGFTPTGVNVEASARQPKKMEASQRFPWKPRDRLSSVGI